MEELREELLRQSPATQVVLALITVSISYIVLNTTLGTLRTLLAAVKHIIPSHRTKHVDEQDSSALHTPIATRPAPQTPGVSMKKLMQSSAKAKANTGPDRHPSELFLATLRGHTDAVTGLAFSSNGRALATACEDRTVRVYDLTNLTAKTIPHRPMEVRTGAVDVAFGNDADHVAVLTSGALGQGSGLCMLDLVAKTPAWERASILPGNKHGVCLQGSYGSAAGPGVLVAASKEPVMRVYSTTGAELAAIDTGGMMVHTMAVSRDGRFVAAATFTSDVKIYEVKFDRTGTYVGTSKVMDLMGHKGQVKAVAFSPDCSKAVTASADGTLRVWNIAVRYHLSEDPKPLVTTGLALPKGSCYSRISWGPDGFLAAVAGSSVHVLDSRTGELVDSISEAHAGGIADVAWAPSRLEGPQGKSTVLATAGSDARVRLWRGPWILA